MVRFFDYWLKGIDTGVMDAPHVTVYVQHFDVPRADRAMTSGVWRHEPGWPLDRAVERTPYLDASGALVAERPTDEGTANYTYNATVGTTFGMFSASSPHVLPVDQRLEDAHIVNWTSGALTDAVEI